MNKLSETEGAYIAGLIDGDGCILLARNNVGTKSWRLKLQLGLCEKDVLDWVSLKVGIGKVIKQRKVADGKTYYSWILCGRTACSLLRQLYPYLRLKKLQADVAFLWEKTVFTNQGKQLPPRFLRERDRLHTIMSGLNYSKMHYLN